MTRYVSWIALAFLFGAPCFASQSFETSDDIAAARELLAKSDDLFAAGRSTAAVDALIKSANLGLPVAQAELADRYRHGRDVPKDLDLAEFLLRQANREFVPAYARDLACVLYEQGKPKNTHEIVRLMDVAVGGGDVVAIALYSRFSRFGIGMPINRGRANNWLERILTRLYVPPKKQDPATDNLRRNLASILSSSDCGPPDEYAAAVARAAYEQSKRQPPPKRRQELPECQVDRGCRRQT